MWDLPGPGLEPVSPALAGRFSTTVPPGKPFLEVLKHNQGLALPSSVPSSHPLWFVVSVVALTVKIHSYEEHMQKHRKVTLGPHSQLAGGEELEH